MVLEAGAVLQIEKEGEKIVLRTVQGEPQVMEFLTGVFKDHPRAGTGGSGLSTSQSIKLMLMALTGPTKWSRNQPFPSR